MGELVSREDSFIFPELVIPETRRAMATALSRMKEVENLLEAFLSSGAVCDFCYEANQLKRVVYGIQEKAFALRARSQ